MNYIEVYPNVLTSEQCKNVIRRINESEKICVSNQSHPITNRPLYYFLPIETKTDPILSGPIQETILKYAYKHSFLIDCATEWEIDSNANLQWYKPGMCFDGEHMETDYDERSKRMLAWMIYLNTVTDGGGTEWLQQNFISDAIEGSMIVWPAGWTHSHRGVVSNTEHKCIITGWCSFVPPSEEFK